MRIVEVEVRTERLPLKQPFQTAHGIRTDVPVARVRIVTDGDLEGWGSASPVTSATGETFEQTERALKRCGAALLDQDPEGCLAHWSAGNQAVLVELAVRTPAATAGIDMALHDLCARIQDLALVDLLGRSHEALPACITLGINALEPTVATAMDWIRLGVHRFKLKLGADPVTDLDFVRQVRDRLGGKIELAVDANQSYRPEQLDAFLNGATVLDLLWIEQPMLPIHDERLREIDPRLRARIAADESLVGEAGFDEWSRPEPPCGVANLKLMKSGGIVPARRAARIATDAGMGIVWGCTGESRIGIAAALHTAYAEPSTRFLDLDGHVGLQHDLASGGFRLDCGRLVLTGGPGLGLTAKNQGDFR